MGIDAVKPEIICFDTVSGLSLHLFCADVDNLRPVIVFLFGGGWLHGDVKHFYQQATYFSTQGFHCICAEYRTLADHPNETPALCLQDVSNMMDFVSVHLAEWHIDPKQIILSGGSAGGHLALCYTLLFSRVRIAALLLFNPVIDTTNAGFSNGTSLFCGREQEFSPMHLVAERLPDMFIAHGEHDEAVSLQSIQKFSEVCSSFGTYVELHVYLGQTHGFFNHPNFRAASNLQMYLQVREDCESFLNLKFPLRY